MKGQISTLEKDARADCRDAKLIALSGSTMRGRSFHLCCAIVLKKARKPAKGDAARRISCQLLTSDFVVEA